MTSLPELGQFVEVRRRQYLVTDIAPSTVSPDPLQPAVPQQNLVSLASIEDDGLGERLQVIWELEPGAAVREQSTLPDLTGGWDSPARLDAFLDALRWGAATSADRRVLHAPFRSGIEIEDYQLEPLVRAVQMARVNLLIADDVGLGKTVEAGLVAQELIVRARARSILVVVPANLQIQWRDQMWEKFGLDFHIVDRELLRDLRRRRGLHVNPWSHFPRLITSMDFLKQDRPLRLFREALPAGGARVYPRPFDLLIIDEAHHVTPKGQGRYAVDTQRTAAIRALVPHFEHRLFVTATPHDGYTESFTALLEMLDNQRFARGLAPDPAQLQAVMVRRLKSELVGWDGTPRFHRRLPPQPLEVPYTESELAAYSWLMEYGRLRQDAGHSQQEKFATEFVLKLLKKRFFSSPAAFAKTLAQHVRSLKRRGAAPSLTALQRQAELVDEDYSRDDDFEEAADEAVDGASRSLRALSAAEQGLLEQLRDWAEDAASRPDSKAHELIAWIERVIRPGKVWSDERVVIFTEYRDTQKWLHDLLAQRGLVANDRLLELHGGLTDEERETIKAAFQAGPRDSNARILLATDAASEGIDLQNHCYRLIHVEIPWNPIRLEQRNGRVDRHGQKHDVEVFHFVAAGYAQAAQGGGRAKDLAADLEFLMRAAQKVEQIRQDLGKVGPVIAAQVEEAMLGKRRTLDTERAERDSEPVRRLLRFERDLKRQIADHYAQLLESRQELRLTAEHVQTLVAVGLELAGQPALQPAQVEGIADGLAFSVPAFTGSWTATTRGLTHPHTGAVRPVVFDHETAKGRDDVVLVHLNHQLVQMCLRLLRAEVWSRDGRGGLHRVAARIVSDETLDTPAVLGYGRLVVTGPAGQRLHEEILAAGGTIREGRFRRFDSLKAQEQALSGVRDTEPPAAVKGRLADLWESLRAPVERALEARMKDREESVARSLEDRRLRDRADTETRLQELERAIRAELAEAGEAVQLELFSTEERGQYERNRDDLRRRLDEIPGELRRELEAIDVRYAGATARLFPAAVVFLVPARLARA